MWVFRGSRLCPNHTPLSQERVCGSTSWVKRSTRVREARWRRALQGSAFGGELEGHLHIKKITNCSCMRQEIPGKHWVYTDGRMTNSQSFPSAALNNQALPKRSSLEGIAEITLGQNLCRILIVFLEFCTQCMLKKYSLGINLQTMHEAENWDCLQDYSSKMGVYFDAKYPEDWSQRVRVKYSHYREGILVIRAGEVGRLSKEAELVIMKNVPQRTGYF